MKSDYAAAQAAEVQRVQALVDQVDLPLPFRAYAQVKSAGSHGMLLVIHARHADSTDATMPDRWWMGRNWHIDFEATDETVLRTLLMAVETYMLHELRENFKFQGRAIFDPHKEVL